MARGEITGKKSNGTEPNKAQPVPTLAMSIPQFCMAHGISTGMYFKLKKMEKGLTPSTMKIGSRTLITFESAAKWRAEREAASTETKTQVAPPAPPAPSAPPAKARTKPKADLRARRADEVSA
jgi:hypothetical protein